MILERRIHPWLWSIQMQEEFMENQDDCGGKSLLENIHIHNLNFIIEFLEFNDKKNLRIASKSLNQRMITLDKSFQELVIPMIEITGNIHQNLLVQTDKEIHLVMEQSEITKVDCLSDDVLSKVIGLRLFNADAIQHVAAIFLWNHLISKLCSIRHLYFKGNYNNKVFQLSTLIEKFGSSLETLQLRNVELEDMQVPLLLSLKKLIMYDCSGNEKQFLENVTQDLQHFEILPGGLTLSDLSNTFSRFQTLNFLSLIQGEEYNSEILDVPHILQKCGEFLRLKKLTLHGVDLSGMSTDSRYNLHIRNLFVNNVKGNSGLMHFISENSPSLKVLIFDTGNQEELDFQLINGIFSHLKHIVLSGSQIIRCLVRNLSSMITKCPFIDELGIEHVHIDCDSGLRDLNIKSLAIGVTDDSTYLCPGFFQLIQASIDHITDLKITSTLDALVNLVGKFKCLNKLVIKESSSPDGKLGLKRLLESCSATIQSLELEYFQDIESIVDYGLSFPKLRHVNRLRHKIDPNKNLEAFMCLYFGVDFNPEDFNTPEFMDPQFEQIEMLFGENKELEYVDWEPIDHDEKSLLVRSYVHLNSCPCHLH